ncbi:Tick transposon [Caligus rogercresseyi]|uniref:Tick transposon n=1 Tax=Caligus rogercresseyi TaxID=217165 RepID=A0A7T8KJL3_CALRO|nr:Tick transposon [Caligus rogercresseyi]
MFKSNDIKKSGTRFSHATGLLPTDVLCKVSDVISRLGDSDTPYEVLKNAILERSQVTLTARFQELLKKEELGDEKPSDLLIRMKRLLEDKYASFDPAFFFQLFYQRLPQYVQRGLFTVKDKMEIEELAKLADEMLTTAPNATACAIGVPTDGLKEVMDQLAEMKVQIAALTERDQRGASVSVVPASPADRAQPEIAYIYAANNSKIPVYKRRTLRLSWN